MRKRHKKNDKKLIFLVTIFVLLLLLLAAYIYIKKPALIDNIPTRNHLEPTSIPAPVVTAAASDSTIKLATFNLQVFGTAKADKPEVMEVFQRSSGTMM